MTATVTSISDVAARFLRRPVSDEQFAKDCVRGKLRGTGCSAQRIEQACARAQRLVAAKYPVDTAVRRAVAWATCADDGRDPPPLAA